jgi:hypothetical protein
VKTPDGAAAPGVTYALSMPVSRRRLAGVRIALGLLELTLLAVPTSILVCALAPTQGFTLRGEVPWLGVLAAVALAAALLLASLRIVERRDF